MTRISRHWFWLLQLFVATVVPAASEAAVTRTPYQQYIVKSCPTGNTCVINFGVVPANVRIELSNASCYIAGTSTPAFTRLDFLQLLSLRADSSVAAAVTLVPHQAGFRNPVVSFAANATVAAFAGATQHFQVIARSLSGQIVNFACNLSGERVQLS